MIILEQYEADEGVLKKTSKLLNTNLAYVLYKGYAAGYGQSEWQWSFGKMNAIHSRRRG